MINAIANFILFQLAWFAAIIGAVHGWPILGSLPSVAVVAIHLWSHRDHLKQEILLVLAVTAMGTLAEIIFIAFGALHYTTANTSVLPPIWIVALWFAFGTLPHGSLKWLSGKIWLQIILGAIFAPLSYSAGVRLGAATFGSPILISFAVIGFGWALALVVIYQFANRLRAEP